MDNSYIKFNNENYKVEYTTDISEFSKKGRRGNKYIHFAISIAEDDNLPIVFMGNFSRKVFLKSKSYKKFQDKSIPLKYYRVNLSDISFLKKVHLFMIINHVTANLARAGVDLKFREKRFKKILQKVQIKPSGSISKMDIESIISSVCSFIYEKIKLQNIAKYTEYYPLESKIFMEKVFNINKENIKTYHRKEALIKSNDLIKDPPGVVAGIIGSWGSGKTTFINEMINNSENSSIIKIDPWGVSSERGQVNIFILNQIIAHLSFNRVFTKKKIDSVINLLATVIDTGLQFVNVKNEPFTKISTTIKNITATLDDLQDDAYKELIDLSDPIIIIIDNLDRSAPNEVFDFIKLVRSFLSLPNVIFILAYDETVIYNGMSSKGLDGNKYFKKIVDIRKYLLPPEKEDIKTILYNEFTYPAHRLKIDSMLQNELFYSITSFKNYRDLYLLIYDVKQIYEKTNIDLESLFYIEDIKHTNLPLWYKLHEYKEVLFDIKKESIDSKIKIKDRTHIALDEILEIGSVSDLNILNHIMPNLFLTVEEFLKASSGKTTTLVPSSKEEMYYINNLNSKEPLNNYYTNKLDDKYVLIEETKKNLLNFKSGELNKIIKLEDNDVEEKLYSFLSFFKDDHINCSTLEEIKEDYNYIFLVLESKKSVLTDKFLFGIDGNIARLLSMSLQKLVDKKIISRNLGKDAIKYICGSEQDSNYLSKIIFFWLAFNPDNSSWRFSKDIYIISSLYDDLSDIIIDLFPQIFNMEIFDFLIWNLWEDLLKAYNVESKNCIEDDDSFSVFNKAMFLKYIEHSPQIGNFLNDVDNSVISFPYLSELHKEEIKLEIKKIR